MSTATRRLNAENNTGKEIYHIGANVRSDIEDRLIEAVYEAIRGAYLRPFRDFLNRYGREVFPADDVEEYLAHDGRCWFAVHWTGASLWRCMPLYEHCANKLLACGITPPNGNEFLNY